MSSRPTVTFWKAMDKSSDIHYFILSPEQASEVRIVFSVSKMKNFPCRG